MSMRRTADIVHFCRRHNRRGTGRIQNQYPAFFVIRFAVSQLIRSGSVKKMLRTEGRGVRNQKDCAMISDTVNDKMYHGMSYIPADSESDLQMSAVDMEKERGTRIC